MTDPTSRPPAMPRWLRVSAVVAAALALAVVVVLVIAGGGNHGPTRHGASGWTQG